MMRKLGKKTHEMVESVEAYGCYVCCNSSCNSMCPSNEPGINQNIWRGQYN